MGEVRKRKVSSDGDSSKTESSTVVVQKQGMGFVSVVMVAALLAGSGCYVLKKDQAIEFDAVRNLAAQLKADSTKTMSNIAAMQKGLDAKDSIIKELQEQVTATHDKNELVQGRLKDLVDMIETMDSAITTDIDVKYQDLFDELKRQAQSIGSTQKLMLSEQLDLEELVLKLEDMEAIIQTTSDDSDKRAETISSLSSQLDETKADTDYKLTKLQGLVTNSGVDVAKLDNQALELEQIQKTIAVLEEQLKEDSAKVVEIENLHLNQAVPSLERSFLEQNDKIKKLADELATTASSDTINTINSNLEELQSSLISIRGVQVPKAELEQQKSIIEQSIRIVEEKLTSIADEIHQTNMKLDVSVTDLTQTIDDLKFTQSGASTPTEPIPTETEPIHTEPIPVESN